MFQANCSRRELFLSPLWIQTPSLALEHLHLLEMTLSLFFPQIKYKTAWISLCWRCEQQKPKWLIRGPFFQDLNYHCRQPVGKSLAQAWTWQGHLWGCCVQEIREGIPISTRILWSLWYSPILLSKVYANNIQGKFNFHQMVYVRKYIKWLVL